jgi:signal peptidase I
MSDESRPAPIGAASPDGVADSSDEIGDAQEAKPGKSGLRVTVEWVAVLAGALALALILRAVLFQAYYIRFTSMEPTLSNGDRVLVNKLGYDLHDINRGDLVVFERPQGVGGQQTDDLIKRVIALPGEVIRFVEGNVYIDDRRLHEPYLESSGITAGSMPAKCAPLVNQGCLVGAGEVFVMGDNRANSTDSRSFGPISEHLIVGHAFLRIWPVTEFGRL